MLDFKLWLRLGRWHHRRWGRQALQGVRGRVLNIGTGDSWLARAIINNNKAIELFEIDVMVQAGASVTVVGNGERLPFKNDSFAGVIASDVLEHVNHPALLMSEISRVLKPNGRLYLVVPLERAWWIVDYWLERLVDWQLKREILGHMHRFTLQELKALVAKSGLAISRQRFSHHWLYQAGSTVYFGWLHHRRIRSVSGENLPMPGWIRVGVILFGWLTVVESWLLGRVPGREWHAVLIKAADTIHSTPVYSK